ncbi:hypothetical protein M404DRAFT_716576 [Pisolithus tinctorius Marx 270]|uniref:Uncharacterized protein n=1 Tax=Pisolithus tinctorius Marx 270 TaxID=870435 RepID=A0A0C3P3Q3_PISTI|nr:hypothetical protein M404DRAFT_716576 [Pisolithus tinctorius Marx 270]
MKTSWGGTQTPRYGQVLLVEGFRTVFAPPARLPLSGRVVGRQWTLADPCESSMRLPSGPSHVQPVMRRLSAPRAIHRWVDDISSTSAHREIVFM